MKSYHVNKGAGLDGLRIKEHDVPVPGPGEVLVRVRACYGLTAAIFTRDMDAARHLGQQLETGTVFMNRCDYLDPALAWTGVKHTGHGISLSIYGYHMLTRVKSYHLRAL